jgi:hypothetical protein
MLALVRYPSRMSGALLFFVNAAAVYLMVTFLDGCAGERARHAARAAGRARRDQAAHLGAIGPRVNPLSITFT